MPSLSIVRIMLKTSKIFKYLANLIKIYLKTDILKSRNDLHKNPEKLQLIREKLFPLIFNDYRK